MAAPASAADWTLQTVDTAAGKVGAQSSITVHLGRLVVAYRDNAGPALRIALAQVDAPAATMDWQVQTLPGLDPFNMPRKHALQHHKVGHLHIEDWES